MNTNIKNLLSPEAFDYFRNCADYKEFYYEVDADCIETAAARVMQKTGVEVGEVHLDYSVESVSYRFPELEKEVENDEIEIETGAAAIAYFVQCFEAAFKNELETACKTEWRRVES